MISRILTISIMLITSSCAFFVPESQIWILENKANFDLNIRFFKKSKLLRPFDIKAKSKIENKTNIDPSNLNTIYPDDADSIVIKYSDGKGYIQYCEGKNIFQSLQTCKFEKNFYDQGFVRYKPVDKAIYKMTFTEEDYQKAKPL